MGLQYKVPEYKRIRVIIDTDAACEADDPFAIAHALLCEKFEVKAIFAEQFGSQDSTVKSYEEILTILDCMDIRVPVFMGEEGSLADVAGKELSPAGKFLIKEALREEERPLYVLCLGAITNVATAMKQCPDIIPRMTVIWIGGQDPANVRPDFREFNSGNDIEAANYVVTSGVKLWMIPSNVYGSMHMGLAEIQRRIYPCGRIGKHLFENMITYNFSQNAGWTAGESWSLGDSPAVGVALDPNCGRYIEMEAPVFEQDTTYRLESGRPKIRVYTSVNVRFILEDMIAKLELVYGSNSEIKDVELKSANDIEYMTTSVDDRRSDIVLGSTVRSFAEVAGFINQYYALNNSVFAGNADPKFSKKLSNAIKAYASTERAEEVFALYDDTAFGSGKEGFVMTMQGIVIKTFLQDTVKCSYSDIRGFKLIFSEANKNVTLYVDTKNGQCEITKLLGEANSIELVNRINEIVQYLFGLDTLPYYLLRQRISK